MKYEEIRTLNRNDLHILCVNNNWYTSGYYEEYSNLLEYVSTQNMSTHQLVVVAEDIVIHTDPEAFKDCEVNGTTPMLHVLHELANACHIIFMEVK